MPEHSKNTCGSCKYSGYIHAQLSCLRYPPTVVFSSHDNQYNLRPLVEKDMWCGEYRSNSEVMIGTLQEVAQRIKRGNP